MNTRRLFSTLFGTVVLSTLVIPTNAQLTDQVARDYAGSAIRSQLHLRADEFLDVQRDEGLEQSLAVAVGRRAGSEFVYKVSPTGYEIKENTVVHHVIVDGDYLYIIAVSPTDGARIV